MGTKKVKIETFGCQMNKSDSEKMFGLLGTIGYEPTELTEDADLILVNTCSIRENAVNRLVGHLGSFKKLKQYNPELIIGVGGCVPQHEKENIRKKARHVDIVFGSQNFNKIHEMVQRFENKRKPIVEIVKQADVYEDDMPVYRENKYSAWITIMNGCSRFCTFCIVPYVRGNETSRSVESIMTEVENAAAEGYKEIVLLGQIIDLYGRDLRPRTTLDELLYKVSEVKGIERIRFLTSHPKYMTREMIDAVANIPKVCEFVHLPLQSGNDRILKEMNRRNTMAEYDEIASYIKAKIPNVVFTSDFIVGFPGETEEEFLDTVNTCIKYEFDSIMSSAYSPRPGTPAADMPNQLPEEEKNRRLNHLNRVMNDISKKRNLEHIGRTESVLVEGFNPKKGNYYGRTRGNKNIHFLGDDSLLGQIIDVKVTDATSSSLRGEILKPANSLV
ncbi:MAG: tRNA (N6-isopentenyl adenosine(37)-C2)-methylthiotransferase MiaB [Candidatus Sericytochromatia bacterium]